MIKFYDKIEDMPREELEQRLRESLEKPLPPIKPMPFRGRDTTVKYRYPELVALCPMTGLPDLYDVFITLIPNGHVPELKSLRKYFVAYKDLPISHEHLCYRIQRDLNEVLKPKYVKVILKVAVRGGIHTLVITEPRRRNNNDTVRRV